MSKGKTSSGPLIPQPRNLIDINCRLEEIPIKKINSAGRIRKDMGNLKELALSIRQKGQIQPITVMEYGDEYHGYLYRLLGGERRFLAMKEELKRETISANIYPPDLNSYEIMVIELEENFRRKNMTDAEEALLFKRICEHYFKIYGRKFSTSQGAEGVSLRDIAKKMKMSSGKASQDLEMAKWLEEVPELQKLKTRKEIRRAIEKAKRTVKVEEKLAEQEDLVGDAIKRLEVMKKAYIFADFFEGIKKIKPKSFNLVDLDIDFPQDSDLDNFPMKQLDTKVKSYKKVSEREFPDLMQGVLKESYRVLKNPGWLILWIGRYHFQKVQEWAEEVGFTQNWRLGIWKKERPMAVRNPEIYLGPVCEVFFYLRKGNAKLSRSRGNIFEYPNVPQSIKRHPCEKPVELMEDILTTFAYPASDILIPFAGSGNTLIASFRQQMNPVGFDVSKVYKNSYTATLLKEVQDGTEGEEGTSSEEG